MQSFQLINAGRLLPIVVALLALAVGSCGSKPEETCASEDAKVDALKLIYGDAQSVIEAFKADGSLDNIADAESELTKLTRENPLSYDLTTLDSFDEHTRKVICLATVSIHLMPSDRTSVAVQMARTIIGLDIPPDLLGRSPKTSFKFFQQPSADGKQLVTGLIDAVPAVSSLVYIAVLRARLMGGRGPAK